MDSQLAIICFLTFLIHLIGTLAYSVRIAGVRTRRIAVSFALFNVLILVSRTSNTFQAPFLSKRVEQTLLPGHPHDLLSDFRWLLASATVATLIAGFLIPTFQRLFTGAVVQFQTHRSLPKLILYAFFKGGIFQIKDSVRLPATSNIKRLRVGTGVSWNMIVFNVIAMALWTVGVFASLYAGSLKPELRATCTTLSGVVNGLATVLMTVMIDPQVSMMTDEVMEGRVTHSTFRQTIVWLVGSRLVGTLLAQLLLVPSAKAVVFVAERL